jgi:uncharacterized protein
MKVCQTTGFRRPARGLLTLALLLLVLSSAVPARPEKVEQLAPQGYVNDFAGVVDADLRGKITALCQEVDQKAGAQIAVVTIHSLEGGDVEDFANRLFEKWGVGPKGKDRGLLILLAVDDRKYRTEVGYGLEAILPDGKVGSFGREMVPLLGQRQYGAALWQITSEIAGVIAADRNVTLTLTQGAGAGAGAGAGDSGEAPDEGIPGWVTPLIFLVLFGGWQFLPFFLAMAGRPGYRRGRGYRGGGWGGSMMGGGGYGGGGWGGGGGFGGFGGGMSGGGGASGSW